MGEEDEHSRCEFYYPEDLETFNVETETGITECHIIKNLLTELARVAMGNIGPKSFARSILPRPRANRELKQRTFFHDGGLHSVRGMDRERRLWRENF